MRNNQKTTKKNENNGIAEFVENQFWIIFFFNTNIFYSKFKWKKKNVHKTIAEKIRKKKPVLTAAVVVIFTGKSSFNFYSKLLPVYIFKRNYINSTIISLNWYNRFGGKEN